MNTLLIVSLVLGSIGIISVIIVGVILAGRLESTNNKIDENEELNKKQFDEIQSHTGVANVSLKQGPQGTQGQRGPAGPPGGTFSGVGPLMCVGQKKVATPTNGTTESAIIYLDDKQYTPVQYWFLENNDNGTVSIKNKYTGNCMTTNDLGDIFSAPCRNDGNQQFIWGQNMQLSSVLGQNKCIGIENYERNPSNSNNSYNLSDLSVKRGSNNGNVQRLKLSDCSASQNLNQTWYVGN